MGIQRAEKAARISSASGFSQAVGDLPITDQQRGRRDMKFRNITVAVILATSLIRLDLHFYWTTLPVDIHALDQVKQRCLKSLRSVVISDNAGEGT